MRERLTIKNVLVFRQEGGILAKINGKIGVELHDILLNKISVIGEY